MTTTIHAGSAEIYLRALSVLPVQSLKEYSWGILFYCLCIAVAREMHQSSDAKLICCSTAHFQLTIKHLLLQQQSREKSTEGVSCCSMVTIYQASHADYIKASEFSSIIQHKPTKSPRAQQGREERSLISSQGQVICSFSFLTNSLLSSE